MALGYCQACDKLTPIAPREHRWGSREREWYPLEHETPATHRTCGRVPVHIGFGLLGCPKCDVTVDESNLVPGTRCDGTKRPIR